MKVFAPLLLLASTAIAQIPNIPFTMNGDGMQLQGTFSSGPGGVCCSGVASINGGFDTFGPCKPVEDDPGVYQWRFTVDIEEETFVILLEIDTNMPPGQQLTGWWYAAGVPGPMHRLLT